MWAIYLVDEYIKNETILGFISELNTNQLIIKVNKDRDHLIQNDSYKIKIIPPDDQNLKAFVCSVKLINIRRCKETDLLELVVKFEDLTVNQEELSNHFNAEQQMILSNHKFKILVVDDSKLIRSAIVAKLKTYGYIVFFTENGRDALELINKEDFDLILSDIIMPELDGYKLLEIVKNNKDLNHIPIIMLSGVEEIESVVRCIKMGAEDYFVKNPFNPELKTHKLSGNLQGAWAFSVAYDCRVIFVFKNNEDTVILADIGSHDEVY